MCIRDRKIYYKFENFFNDILFKSRFYKINETDIKKIRENNRNYLLKQNELNDGSGYFKLYDIDNLYGVKRIERDYNDRIRKHIRKIVKG